MDYFTSVGSKLEIKKTLSKIMSESDAEKFINNIECLSIYLDDKEYVKKEIIIENGTPDLMSFIMPKTKYYINLKVTTISILALLLDIKLTAGFASVGLSLKGFNNQAIVEIKEFEGEKCVLLEILRKNPQIADENILPPSNSECINNNLNCMYKKEGMCSITKEVVREILYDFHRKNILTKIENKFKYNL